MRHDNLTQHQEPFYNAAEQQIKHLALSGNVEFLEACMDLARQNPEGMMAEELESASLRVIGFDFFTSSKAAIAKLHYKQPEISNLGSVMEARKRLGKFEDSITKYLMQHTDNWHEIVGKKDDDPVARRINNLDKLSRVLNDSKGNGFALKALSQIGEIKLNSDQFRQGIAETAEGITEIIWSAVQNGRDASAFMEDSRIRDVGEVYGLSTGSLFITASDIATNAIQTLNGLNSQNN